MKVEYVGPEAGGIDVPAADIIRWKPGEVREVPEAIAKSLLERASEFRPVSGARAPRRDEARRDE